MAELSDPNTRIERERFYHSISSDPIARVSFELVATVIFIILLFIVAIRPTIITIRKIQTSLDKLTSFDSSLVTKIDALKDTTTLMQNNKQKFDLLDIAIPNQPEFPLAEKQIRYLVNSNQFEVLSITFSEIPLIGSLEPTDTSPQTANQPKTEVNSIQFNIAATGSYESIKNFLSQVQNLNRLTTIEVFTVNQSATDGKVLSFTMSGTVYYK